MRFSRRKFLQGVSAAALIGVNRAEAGLHSHGSAGPTGKALINDGSSQRSFIWANILKTANLYGPLTVPTYAWMAFLDSNGYPNNAPGNQLSDDIQYRFAIPPAWGTAQLVASWSGTGAFYMQPAAVSNFTIGGGAHVDLSSLPTFIKVTGTDVRITFNFTTAPVEGEDGYIGYFFKTTTYSGFSKLTFCRQSDEAAVIANQNALNPDYVAMLRALNPKTFRGLDISGVNGGNQSQFSQRAPAGAFSFFMDRFPPECWAGTAAGTNTYTCSAPSGWTGLVDGATVQVQFTNANTLTGASVTMNVAGTGAGRITDLGPVDLTAGQISAGSVWTLTYSAIYGYWTGRTSVLAAANASQGGIITRAPLEQHIAVANAVNCNLWYNICHRMAPADGTALTSVVLANLNLWLAFEPELSNEVWNTTFTQTTFIANAGLTMGFPSSGTVFGRQLMGAYGLLVRRMMGAITTAWGGPNSRLRRVMAVQAYGDSTIGGVNDLYRFKGADLAPGNSIYNSFTGSANYTASPDRPIDFSDVPSYATYYSGGQLQQFDASYAPDAASLLANPFALSCHNITGISKANPGVLTYASDPGYITGTRVNLQGIGGMTQLNQLNVTLTRLTSTTYSMFTDVTLATPVDTSAFSVYTSGGTSGIYPLVSGLTAWADLYATSTGPNIASAFNSLDTDIRSGTNYVYGSNSVLSINGTQNLLDLSTNIYGAWNALAATYDGGRPAGTLALAIECYEGAMAGNVPSTASCTALGISTTYATTIGNLLFNYKLDARLSTLVQNQFAQFLAGGSHNKTPGWYQVVGVGGPWALTPTDLYSLPPAGTGEYQSWLGNVTFNH